MSRYYLSSARLGAARFAAAVRSHWRIENSLHWVLDVGFDEDPARNRCDHGPENLGTLRKVALNVLYRQGPTSGPTRSLAPSSAKCDSPGDL